jgi:hypothetical protein
MHRTQSKKKEKRKRKTKRYFSFSLSLSLSFFSLSLSDVWEEIWIETEKPEIAEQYQRYAADILSARSSAQEPQRQRLHQRGQQHAEQQPNNKINDERCVHDAAARATASLSNSNVLTQLGIAPATVELGKEALPTLSR